MMYYKIIDNVLPIETFTKLKLLIEAPNFPWYWIENTAYATEPNKNPNSQFDYSFFHSLFDQNKKQSDAADVFIDAYNYIFTQYRFENPQLIRSRLGMITSREKEYTHGVHIDYRVPHYTLLLYFNNSEDGETHFYNHLYDKDSMTIDDHQQYLDQKDNFEVIEKVKPVENRAVIFNGFIYHASSSPIKSSRRIVNNVNFKATNNNIGLLL